VGRSTSSAPRSGTGVNPPCSASPPTTKTTATPANVSAIVRAAAAGTPGTPKIAVFYTSLLPQLVPPGAPVSLTLLGLVGVHAVLGLVWLNLYAALLHSGRGTLGRPRVRLTIERVTGVVLIGFGLRVAMQHN
jgi:threonine/homoserine/homoserine lactone efflux protein